MRKQFKTATAMALAAAMIVTAVPAGVANAATTEKASTVSYNGYVTFQLGGYWVSRANWNDLSTGRDDVRSSKQITVGDNKVDYSYATQYIDNNNNKVIDGQIKDAVMTDNGEYTVEVGNFPLSSFTNAGGDQWNMLAISTDIPLTVKNITCTDVKVYFDGADKPTYTLAKAPHNQEAKTNFGCYAFYIFDAYYGNHKTKGVIDSEKNKTYPKKSMKITYKLNGMKFDKKVSVATATGKFAGQSFTVNGITYKVLTRAMSDGKAGKVAVSGVAAAGNKASVKLGTSVKDGKNSYSITTINKNAFKKATKMTSLTISDSITSIKSSAFANCKKLKTVKFGKGVKTIPSKAFYGCKSIKAITLGKNVKKIGSQAFAKCTKLSKITAYQKLSVSKKAFKGCTKKISVKGKKASANKKAIIKSGYKKVK